jgi:hypothetical protein
MDRETARGSSDSIRVGPVCLPENCGGQSRAGSVVVGGVVAVVSGEEPTVTVEVRSARREVQAAAVNVTATITSLGVLLDTTRE